VTTPTTPARRARRGRTEARVACRPAVQPKRRLPVSQDGGAGLGTAPVPTVLPEPRATPDRADLAPAQCQSLICTSRGAGAPSPVSTSDFRLIRNEPHLVLQWCMNSTGSFQPWCLNSTIV
jgi:hypothetical protein